MYKVEVKNSCRCFIRSGMFESQVFDSESEAQEVAQNVLQEMQDTFCKKHQFDLQKEFSTYTIYIKER